MQRTQHNMTWVDWLLLKNPQGAMKVLNNNGYNGFLAPQNVNDLYDATYHFIEKYGDDAVVSLLGEHPEFEVLKEVHFEKNTYNNLNDAEANGVVTTNNTSLLEKISKLEIENKRIKTYLGIGVVAFALILLIKKQ